MGGTNKGVVLEPDEVATFLAQLSELRHDVNNHLTLISTGIELIRRNPATAERISENLVNQPKRIRDDLAKFSAAAERLLGGARG